MTAILYYSKTNVSMERLVT